MRRAEITMAVVMGLCAIALMVKSAELPIGWIPEEGPGGGAFSFWLAGGMLVCSIWTAINGWMRKTAPSASTAPYMDRTAIKLFAITAGSLVVMISLIHFIGVYGSIPLFLLFSIHYIGRHSWWLSTAIALITPVVTFFFFEATLKITLPKGSIEWIERTIFFPLYDWFL